MNKLHVIIILDILSFILVTLFLLNNSFSDLYSYGEVNNIVHILEHNWIYLLSLIFLILLQIILIKKDFIDMSKYMPDIIINMITSFWFAFIVIIFIFSIDLESSNVVRYLFAFMTSFVVVVNFRNYGMRIF